METIANYQGSPSSVLRDPRFFRVFAPTLRADFEVVETYEHNDAELLSCPITAFGGSKDPFTPRELLLAWRDLTASDFDIQMFDGNHFFIRGCRKQLLTAIRARIGPQKSIKSLANLAGSSSSGK